MKNMLKTTMFSVFLSFALLAKEGMVKVWVEKGNGNVYSAQEPISIKVLSHTDGYLYLYNIDASGKPQLLFPRHGEYNYISAGRIYHLPYDFEIEVEWFAGEDPGIEYVYAVVVPYPVPYEIGFEPLPPYEAVYYQGFPVYYRVVFPPFFPAVYFYAWSYFYVRPRYYVYHYHPSPWYCYDCHTPHILVSFWFDFCPTYVIYAYDYGYYYYPRYYRYYKYKKIRPIYRELPPKRIREYKEFEKKYRNYDKPPKWASVSENPLKERVKQEYSGLKENWTEKSKTIEQKQIKEKTSVPSLSTSETNLKKKTYPFVQKKSSPKKKSYSEKSHSIDKENENSHNKNTYKLYKYEKSYDNPEKAKQRSEKSKTGSDKGSYWSKGKNYTTPYSPNYKTSVDVGKSYKGKVKR